MRNRFEDLLGAELPEGRLALGVAGGTEAALLARAGEQGTRGGRRDSERGRSHGLEPHSAQSSPGREGRPPGAGRIAVVVQVEEGVRVVRDQLPEWRGVGFAGAIGRRALGGSPGDRGLLREDGQGARHRLIFLGLPRHLAIATDRFASLGAGGASLYRFRPSGKIVWRYVPVLAVASLAGSLIGATVLISAEPGLLRVAVGVLCLVLLSLLTLQRDLAVARREMSRLRIRLGPMLYFFMQTLAGSSGSGTGTLILFILMLCFGVTVTQIAATQILPFRVPTLPSPILFAAGGIINYRIGIVLLAASAVGGYLGAHIAITRLLLP